MKKGRNGLLLAGLVWVIQGGSGVYGMAPGGGHDASRPPQRNVSWHSDLFSLTPRYHREVAVSRAKHGTGSQISANVGSGSPRGGGLRTALKSQPEGGRSSLREDGFAGASGNRPSTKVTPRPALQPRTKNSVDFLRGEDGIDVFEGNPLTDVTYQTLKATWKDIEKSFLSDEMSLCHGDLSQLYHLIEDAASELTGSAKKNFVDWNRHELLFLTLRVSNKRATLLATAGGHAAVEEEEGHEEEAQAEVLQGSEHDD